MRPLWTGAAIAAASGGQLSGAFAVEGVAFDSREIAGGELFVALRGETADGHDFVPQAVARGAAGLLVERPVDAPHVRVSDGLRALEALGMAARARTEATVIGVTGSVGKTGVKEAIRRALQRVQPDATHASVKSYNNHTGVPLSLARMPADSRFGVFEMGMNHSGELSALTRMVQPHVAVVTWVASAHRAFFAEEADIALAKAEIFEGVLPGGTAIYPADNAHAAILRAKIDALGLQPLAFGAAGAVRALAVQAGPDGTELTADVAGETLVCRIGMAGAHWVSNALAVLAAVKAAGGDLAETGLALAELTDLPGRGARVRLAVAGGEALLIDESYNANPASMAAALAVLGAVPAKRRVAVLGAMRELGAMSDEFHAALKAPLATAGVAEVALVGAEMQALKLDGAAYFATADEALAWARSTVRGGDAVLVKGSNSLQLGRVVSGLRGAA